MIIQGVPDLGAGLRLHLNENTGGCSPKGYLLGVDACEIELITGGGTDPGQWGVEVDDWASERVV